MSDFSILFAEREEGRGSYGYPGSKAVPEHRAQSARGRGGKKRHHLLAQALEHIALDWTIYPAAWSAGIWSKRKQREERSRQMMDHERQERDLQEIFDATRASYLAAIENTFALQERTIEFARTLIEAPQEALRARAEDNRARLETLAEESMRHREAMETLVRESARVYESFLRSPFSHNQHHPGFDEAKGAPEVGS